MLTCVGGELAGSWRWSYSGGTTSSTVSRTRCSLLEI